MKKFLLVFLLIQICTLNAQKFDFDYILNSENTREIKQHNYKSYDMVNSKNHNLYMEVAQNTLSKDLYSILLDYSDKIIYRFDINKFANNNLKFNYQYASQMSGKYPPKTKSFKIEKIGDLAYRIYTSTNAKRKYEDFELFINLQPFEDDLLIINFEVFTKEQMNAIENLIKNQLQKDSKIGNFYIKEITYNYFKKSVLNKRITPEKISLTIDIPKEK